MKSTFFSRRRSLLGLAPTALALTLLLAGCASSGRQARPSPPSKRSADSLVGSAGARVVRVRAGQRLEPSRHALDPQLADLTSLTHDPASDTYYGLAAAERGAWLVAFEGSKPKTLRPIGAIKVTGMVPWVAEAIAWDPTTGHLLVAASKLRHTPISSVLLEVDPLTAVGQVRAEISGTTQNEADALVLVGADLLMIDNVVGKARLYRLDRDSGSATPLGDPFEPMIEDLAWDGESGVLYGLSRTSGQLLTLTPDSEGGPQVAVVASTTPAGGEPLATLASSARRSFPDTGWRKAAPGPRVFGDDFESGTAEGWSSIEGQGAPPDGP